jgi:RNA polymerase-interacting CarD/CdnL/TRCF family regulator
MFKKGDAVVHPTYGAGRLVAVRKIEVRGGRQRYYDIKLMAGGNLMLPVTQAEETGLRLVEVDRERIVAVLSNKPHKLSANYRTRQARIDKKISSGDPLKVAEALRDLTWRGKKSSGSATDVMLKLKARRLLAGELALQSGDLDIDEAAERLDGIIRCAMTAAAATAGGG